MLLRTAVANIHAVFFFCNFDRCFVSFGTNSPDGIKAVVRGVVATVFVPSTILAQFLAVFTFKLTINKLMTFIVPLFDGLAMSVSVRIVRKLFLFLFCLPAWVGTWDVRTATGP